jgi:phage terminase large subunit-like protein
LRARFRVREVRYDPYQMAATAQRMRRVGLPMVEFPQSLSNLTAASQNLFELIKAQGIVTYPDADIRLALQRSIAVETTRGWRIAKEKVSHRIDVVVRKEQKLEHLLLVWKRSELLAEEAVISEPVSARWFP